MDLNYKYDREALMRFYRDEFLPGDFQPMVEDVEMFIRPKSVKRLTLLGKCPSWDLNDPKNDTECKTCKHLPLCEGGCVLNAMRGKKSCSYWKDNLDDMLSVLAYKYQNLVKLNS